jgi:hypothetical protein
MYLIWIQRIIPYHSSKIKKVLLTKELVVSKINTGIQNRYRRRRNV